MAIENKDMDYKNKRCKTCFWIEGNYCIYKKCKTTPQAFACILHFEGDDIE